MIPIQLTIEGLYSYQKRQTIDFSNLVEAGLFGIFGAVGSGKSSILEAITFALYGNSDRLGATNFAYNMMNLKSNKLFIDFEFSNHEGKIFKITREYKRNGKNFDKIVNSGVVLYEKDGENWLPLPSSDVEPIIGLSSKNFRRTIIIPQGQFKDFIELGAKDRTQMMKEIFNLHQYDLQDKVSALNSKNLTNLNQLEGKLSGFEAVSEEGINELKTQLQSEKEKTNEIHNEFSKIKEVFQQLKALKLDFENLNLKKKEFENLTDKKSEVDSQKTKLETYEKVFSAFQQILLDEKKLNQELQEKSSESEIQRENLEKLQTKIDEISQQIGVLKPDYEQLSIKRLEEQDLEFLAQIKSFEQEIKTLKERTENGKAKLKEIQEKEKSLSDFIQNQEKEIAELSTKKLDSQLLLNIGNWFNENENLSKNNIQQTQKTQQLQQQIDYISTDLKSKNIDEKASETDYKKASEDLVSKKKKLETQKNQLEVQKQLSHFAHNLQDGEACPLCGALEHPNIAELEDVSEQLNAISEQILNLETKQESLQKQFSETEKAISKKQIFEDQIKAEHLVLKDIETKILDHQKQFVWTEFKSENKEDFEQKKSASAQLEKEIDAKSKVLKESREVLENDREKSTKFTKALQDFLLDEAQKNTQIDQNKANLKVLVWENFEQESKENIQEQLKVLQAKNQKLEKDFKQLSEEFAELNPKLASQKTTLDLLKNRISELKLQSDEIKDQIYQLLATHQFETLEDVQSILNWNLDVSNLRKNIENFTISYETLKNAITELELKLKDFSFDENQFLETENQFKAKETEWSEANKLLIETSAEIARLELEFKKKEDLLKEFSELSKRGENLKIMSNLFKASGFVEYASSIHLKQLCNNANIRFHRMTRNQLSLQINENNDFEIIDYLNEGKSRSVKTLSGGQSFQVSLSLALALAESVQSNAKAEKNFFFIDEGFGTQDSDSVNIVFETLMSLQKENRIVGIISHVEELKDRIPMAISVIKDEEEGSLLIMD